MAYSISTLTRFTEIDWNNFNNRPAIDSSMPFCNEKDWYRDRRCCMDGYTIEHVRDMAYDNRHQNTAEARFLDEYPCVNGVELDQLIDKMAGSQTTDRKKTQSASFKSASQSFFIKLINELPNSLLKRFKNY